MKVSLVHTLADLLLDRRIEIFVATFIFLVITATLVTVITDVALIGKLDLVPVLVFLHLVGLRVLWLRLGVMAISSSRALLLLVLVASLRWLVGLRRRVCMACWLRIVELNQ